jgi:hypothetical protein
MVRLPPENGGLFQIDADNFSQARTWYHGSLIMALYVWYRNIMIRGSRMNERACKGRRSKMGRGGTYALFSIGLDNNM